MFQAKSQANKPQLGGQNQLNRKFSTKTEPALKLHYPNFPNYHQ
jgi:hypothetical protein